MEISLLFSLGVQSLHCLWGVFWVLASVLFVEMIMGWDYWVFCMFLCVCVFLAALVLHKGDPNLCLSMKNWWSPLCRYIGLPMLSEISMGLICLWLIAWLSFFDIIWGTFSINFYYEICLCCLSLSWVLNTHQVTFFFVSYDLYSIWLLLLGTLRE